MKVSKNKPKTVKKNNTHKPAIVRKKTRQPTVSVVIPVCNEEENLEPLNENLLAVLSRERYNFEVTYVDDGSTDASFSVMRRLAEKNKRVRLIQFSGNFGQTAAIAAGIEYSTGDTIVLMDADQQNDPADIPAILAKLEEGYDLVSGWRNQRRDPWLTKKFPSKMANILISYVTGLKLHDYGCTLKAYRMEVFRDFRLYGEMHRLIPAYAMRLGARITEVPVNHHPRIHGSSKYGLSRIYKVILDLLTIKFLSRYAAKPLYLFGKIGLLLMLVASLVVLYLIGDKVLYDHSLVQSPLLLMSVMLYTLGFQCIFIGLLAEMLVRTYHESQNKPIYVVRQRINTL